jgi:hypothetical protein
MAAPLGALLGVLLGVPLARAEKARVPPPSHLATSYEMRDSHAGVTIAAVPGDTKDTQPNTRLDYYDHGMMPIRVIVTNDTEFDVELDQARIDFIAGDNTVVQAATLDDLDRRLFSFKSATGTRLPLGLPIPITVGKKDVNKKIEQDDHDFGFQTTRVKPHATVAGWLYYDMQQAPSPFLDHATLELRRVRFVGSGKVLDSFEIPLHADKDAKAPKDVEAGK